MARNILSKSWLCQKWKPIDNLGVHLNQAQFLMNVKQIKDIFFFQSPYPLQVKRNSRQKWKFYSWKNTVYWK